MTYGGFKRMTGFCKTKVRRFNAILTGFGAKSLLAVFSVEFCVLLMPGSSMCTISKSFQVVGTTFLRIHADLTGL